MRFKWKLVHMMTSRCRCARHVSSLSNTRTRRCYGNHISPQTLGVVLLPSLFMRFKLKLVHMMTPRCRCARHVFQICQTRHCYGNHIFAQLCGMNFLHQFSCDSNESWYTWCPWDADVQNCFSSLLDKDIAMATTFLQKLCGMDFLLQFSCDAN